jgi:hypothetical protein
VGDGWKIMGLELMLEDNISFEATECNNLVLFKEMNGSLKNIFGSYY